MKTKKGLQEFGVVIAGLLLIAAFADMQVSQIIYNPDSIFGKIFEAVGEFPAALIGAFCAMSMALALKKRNQEKLNLKSIGCFVLSALLALMAGGMIVSYLNGPKPLILVVGVAAVAVVFLLSKKAVENNCEEVYKAAVLGLKLFLLVIVLFNLFKMGWGRERFRHMAAINDFTGFSPWYLPQGFTTENEFMSFPSGHSANASVLIWLTLLPNFVPALKDKEKRIRIFCFIWMACVMVSRVIMGAHFMSDVIAGMSLTMVVFYRLYQKTYIKNK